METPTLQPWMITILQRLALNEKQRLVITPDAKSQIRALKREKGPQQAAVLERKFIEAAAEDSKNEFTDIGKVQKIIERLDQIAEHQASLISA